MPDFGRQVFGKRVFSPGKVWAELVACMVLLVLLSGCGSARDTKKQKQTDNQETTQAPLTPEQKAALKEEEALKFLDQVFDWYNDQDAESLAQNMSPSALAAQKRTVSDQQKIYEKEFEKDKISLIKVGNFRIQNLDVWGLKASYTYDGIDKEMAFTAFQEKGKWVYCNYEGFREEYLK